MKYLLRTHILIILLLGFAATDIMVGSINIFDSHTDVYTLLMYLRIPKTLTAIAIGSIVALCGLILQIIFRNPLAEPYVLGVSGASSLFTAIGLMGTGIVHSRMLYYLELNALSIIGAACGILIIMMVMNISSQITFVLIVGVMLSQLYGAIQTVLVYLSTEQSLKAYTMWTMGSIQHTTIHQALFLFLLSLFYGWYIVRHTKTWMLYITGDDMAKAMGIDIDKMKKISITIVAIVIGIVTAYCGPVALVGMTVPILVRIITHCADVSQWIIYSSLLGSISLLLTDIANQIFFDGAMALNTLISMWAVPIIIWIFIQHLKWIVI